MERCACQGDPTRTSMCSLNTAVLGSCSIGTARESVGGTDAFRTRIQNACARQCLALLFKKSRKTFRKFDCRSCAVFSLQCCCQQSLLVLLGLRPVLVMTVWLFWYASLKKKPQLFLTASAWCRFCNEKFGNVHLLLKASLCRCRFRSHCQVMCSVQWTAGSSVLWSARSTSCGPCAQLPPLTAPSDLCWCQHGSLVTASSVNFLG